MTTLNSLHIDIAKVLMQCAKETKTITYGELCKEVSYNSPRTMGAVLDPLTKLTYKKYGVFISVLVVRSETQNDNLPMPSDGFFEMYHEFAPSSSLSDEEIVQTQRELTYKQDWSKLPELIRAEISE